MDLTAFWGRDVTEATAYGLAESREAAAERAYDDVPGNAYGIEETHKTVDVPQAAVSGHDGGLHLVAVVYTHDPVYDPAPGADRTPADHPINDLSGVTHPNDELSSVPHPLDWSRR